MKKIILILFLLLLTGCGSTISTPIYDISVSDAILNGEVEVIEEAKYLDYVTLNIFPNEGYEIDAIYINGEKVTSITFLMPDGDVEILV